MLPEQFANGFPAELRARTSPPPALPTKARPYVVKAYEAADLAVLLLSMFGVFFAANFGAMLPGVVGFLMMQVSVKNALLVVGFYFWARIVLRACKLYESRTLRNAGEEARRVIVACTLCALALALLSPWAPGTGSPAMLLNFWLFSMGGMIAARNAVHVLRPDWTRFGWRSRRLLIIGSGPRALELYRMIAGQPESEDTVVGFLDDSPAAGGTHRDIALRLLGPLESLEEILAGRCVDEVLIALPIKSCYDQIQDAIRTCERVGVECHYLATIFEVSHARPRRSSVISLKMVSDDYRQMIKRAMDIAGAATGLLLLSPLMLLAAIAVWLSSPGPVIFAQDRYGLNRRKFRMYKFRSMIVNAEALQHTLEERNEAQGPVFKIRRDPRVTRVGRFLRKTSIDELPQLVNVLLGDMSLVGPRPLPERDVARFPEAGLLRRFSVKPGLTCLWQISGRSDTDFDNWIRQDLHYIDHWSIGLDLRILLKTPAAVLRGRGAA